MKQKKRNTLRDRHLMTEICITVFSFFFIFMGSLIVISTNIIKTQTRNSYYEMAQEIVKSRSDEITKWIEIYMNDLKVYSESDAALSGDIDEMVSWLKHHNRLRNSIYEDLFFCDRNAIPYWPDGRVGEEGEFRSKDYHHAIIFDDEDYYIGRVEISPITGDYVLPLARAS